MEVDPNDVLTEERLLAAAEAAAEAIGDETITGHLLTTGHAETRQGRYGQVYPYATRAKDRVVKRDPVAKPEACYKKAPIRYHQFVAAMVEYLLGDLNHYGAVKRYGLLHLIETDEKMKDVAEKAVRVYKDLDMADQKRSSAKEISKVAWRKYLHETVGIDFQSGMPKPAPSFTRVPGPNQKLWDRKSGLLVR